MPTKTNPIPARVVHPKDIFIREMDSRNETVESLEDKTGIPWGIWEQVRLGGRIDDVLAHALESWWGVDTEFWLNLWANYDKHLKTKRNLP